MATIIGFSGKITSGKDEAAKVIREMVDGWEVKKYGGKLKEVASLLLNIPARDFESREVKDTHLPDWNMTVREFLQKLGTDAVRNGLHTNAWINALFTDLKSDSKWLITDVRFPNEVQAIKDRGGYVIRIERPGLNTGSHPSETALDGLTEMFDVVIVNDGTLEDFRRNVWIQFAILGLKHGQKRY